MDMVHRRGNNDTKIMSVVRTLRRVADFVSFAVRIEAPLVVPVGVAEVDRDWMTSAADADGKDTGETGQSSTLNYGNFNDRMVYALHGACPRKWRRCADWNLGHAITPISLSASSSTVAPM